jgi:hypothetical protein
VRSSSVNPQGKGIFPRGLSLERGARIPRKLAKSESVSATLSSPPILSKNTTGDPASLLPETPPTSASLPASEPALNKGNTRTGEGVSEGAGTPVVKGADADAGEGAGEEAAKGTSVVKNSDAPEGENTGTGTPAGEEADKGAVTPVVADADAGEGAGEEAGKDAVTPVVESADAGEEASKGEDAGEEASKGEDAGAGTPVVKNLDAPEGEDTGAGTPAGEKAGEEAVTPVVEKAGAGEGTPVGNPVFKKSNAETLKLTHTNVTDLQTAIQDMAKRCQSLMSQIADNNIEEDNRILLRQLAKHLIILVTLINQK